MSDISPTAEQGAAIKSIVEWYGNKKGPQEFYLAGYAGVGKSTIAAIAIEEIRSKRKLKKACTATYTGKAASVLRKKGISDAQTIHSLIYEPKIDKATGEIEYFALNADGVAANANLIILDECSMVDKEIADDLRSFGKKILIMGDPGQLPPINGQGEFTNREPDVFLREIHRQSAESPILELATLARQGKRLPVNYHKGDVRILPLTNRNAGLIHNENTQVICGLNRVRWTVTQRIRNALLYEGITPIEGEKIICCKNNHKRGIFNGVMGRLAAIDTEAHDLLPGSFLIDFDADDDDDTLEAIPVDDYLFRNHFNGGTAKKIEYVKGRPPINEFDWGYAITGHKAQGSSWPHVTVIDDSGSFRENRNKWLYTAITRAETGLTLLVRPS